MREAHAEGGTGNEPPRRTKTASEQRDQAHPLHNGKAPRASGANAPRADGAGNSPCKHNARTVATAGASGRVGGGYFPARSGRSGEGKPREAVAGGDSERGADRTARETEP